MFWQYRRFGDGIDGQQRVVGDDDIGQAGRSTSPFGEALRAKRAAGHAEAFPRRNADLRPGSVSHTGPVDGSESFNAALRSLHEPEIIDAKRVAAQQLLDTVPDNGGRLELTESDANAWIAAVNDLRLALGVMLEIGPRGPERLPGNHPLAAHFNVYQWLTVLQEYLVLVLMGSR